MVSCYEFGQLSCLFRLYDLIYGGSSVWGSGWWFSILLLWRRIDMAYFIAIVLMFLKVFLMVGIGILNLFSSAFIDGMCVVALAPAVIVIRGSTFHSLAAILSINGLYLLFFASNVSGENLSLQYVKFDELYGEVGVYVCRVVILVW
jgi:hypothetical protein